MWITLESAELDIDLKSVKLLGASLATNNISGPVREVRVTFVWGSHQLRLRGVAAQELWEKALEWNQRNETDAIPLAWYGPPHSGPIEGGLL